MSRLTQLSALAAALAVSGRFTHPSQIVNGLSNDERARVMNAFTPGNPAGLAGAMGFNVNIFEQIVARTETVKLPEILWNTCLPPGSLDTSVNVGAKLASYRVRDRRGKGAFRASVGKDIPTVGVTTNKVSIPLESSAVHAQADLDDIQAVAFGFEGMSLLTDLGAVMREASERHIDETFFFGFSALGFAGYVDYSLVPATTAGAKVAGGTTWAVATPDEIIKDVQTAISTVWENSKGLFIPGRVELPLKQFGQIASMRINGTSGNGVNETVLSFLKKNNLFTQLTGEELTIVPIRHFKGAGAGVTDRMKVSEFKADNHYMPMPEVFNMLPPQDEQFATNLFAKYKFGSYHSPYPTSAIFVDGI